jgi:hypothetical protein
MLLELTVFAALTNANRVCNDCTTLLAKLSELRCTLGNGQPCARSFDGSDDEPNLLRPPAKPIPVQLEPTRAPPVECAGAA